MRNTLLVSSVLCNSETWFNLTKGELDLLETVDVMLLRNILGAPTSTPKEMLFLELGLIPFREIIKCRRLLFLHYILNQDPKSLIFKILEAQIKNQTSKDWVNTIIADLESLVFWSKIYLSFLFCKSAYKDSVLYAATFQH